MTDMAEPRNEKETPLTVRETELAVAMVQSLEGGEIKIDMAKFVALTGFANQNSARTSIANLRKNLSSATAEAYYVPHSKAGANLRPKKPRAPKAKGATQKGGKAAAKASQADTGAAMLPIGDGNDDEKEETNQPDKKRAATDELEKSNAKHMKKQPEVKDEEKDEEA
ncbi:MAG: hypothetical protein Q9222_005396 [Ikaeria aurantiellina]